MSELERITVQLRRAYDGDAWYGPSLRSLLADVTPQEAAAHPIAGAHSILDLALHVTAWMGVIRTRVATGRVELPPEGDWPASPSLDDAGWQQVLAAMDERHQALVEEVAALPASRLLEHLGTLRDADTGAGMTVYATVLGIVEHNTYHAGQIALLKKALRAG